MGYIGLGHIRSY